MSIFDNRKRKNIIRKYVKELDKKGYFLACNDKFYKAEEINFDPNKINGSGLYRYEVSGYGVDDPNDFHECDLIHCYCGAYTLEEIERIKNGEDC